MGLREIVRELNEKAITTTKGGKWYAGTIKYILENPLYNGIAHYKENKIKNKDLALVLIVLNTRIKNIIFSTVIGYG